MDWLRREIWQASNRYTVFLLYYVLCIVKNVNDAQSVFSMLLSLVSVLSYFSTFARECYLKQVAELNF